MTFTDEEVRRIWAEARAQLTAELPALIRRQMRQFRARAGVDANCRACDLDAHCCQGCGRPTDHEGRHPCDAPR